MPSKIHEEHRTTQQLESLEEPKVTEKQFKEILKSESEVVEKIKPKDRCDHFRFQLDRVENELAKSCLENSQKGIDFE